MEIAMKNKTHIRKKTDFKTKEDLIKLSGLELFEQAFTHKGFLKSEADNERLEFLGDAVLNFLGADLLYKKHPDLQEGSLTKIRAGLLSGSTLAEIARELNFQNYIRVQEEEDKNNSRLLAGALEAYTAAVYLKRGFVSVRKWAAFLLKDRLEEEDKNYKSQLQEWCQKTYHQLPSYKLVKQEGKDHNKNFHIEVFINGGPIALGKGFSKRKAQQSAAEQALKKLKI